jgi:UDP:flavonoid glycosyltransferase YjiC (YdhE family)
MLITIVTAGSRGDVQPYVALGLGLRRAGHRVRLATHETFRDFVAGYGLEFEALAGDPRAILRGAAADAWLASGRNRNMLGFMREFRRTAGDLVEQWLHDYWRIGRGADAVIFSAVTTPAHDVARRLGVPSVAAYLQPLSRTSEFPTIGLLGAGGGSDAAGARTQPGALRRAFNYATHVAAEQAMWQPFRGRVNRWRAETLGVPRAPFLGPHGAMWRERVPVLYGFSPRVVPKPGDWGAHVHVTGYWVLPLAESWRPAPALEAFLAAGEPPVYVGFGSMTPASAGRLTEIALAALERAGQRGVFLKGWGSLGEGTLPSWATAVSDVPHEWLLPRMQAVVHHGGAGTTGAALRSGAPSIVVPLGFDQPFWGRRVSALGVGPPPLPRRGLAADALARAVERAVGDTEMRARAATLGAALRAEDGVSRAVEAIDAELRFRTG